MNPKYPLYIPSKGRAHIRLTSDALTEMKVPHNLVIEEQEYELYHEATKNNKFVTLIILDESYKDTYETLDNLGRTKSVGAGPARNFIWEHSIKAGHEWHWVMDDNIKCFYRYNNNEQIRVGCGTGFRTIEDFCERYENVVMAGPNYFMFVPRKYKQPPYILNTRIYSCNFIKNDIPFRWTGRYNEDTILSLNILRADLCTLQFNHFLQAKTTTSKIEGGNTAEFYSVEGTLPKSQMLVDVFPDNARLVQKYNRWHHYVDYSVFKKNNLKFKNGVKIPNRVNEYGMKIKKIKSDDKN